MRPFIGAVIYAVGMAAGLFWLLVWLASLPLPPPR